MTVKVVTDSASDLSPEVYQSLGITVIPLKVRFGERVYEDGVDLSNEEFYHMLDTSPAFPQTSAQAPGVFADTYHRLSQEADGIISIHIAANLSATLDSARMGAEKAEVPLKLIDSQSASMGLGLLAVIAAALARDGASLEEIEAELNSAIPNTVVYGLFDTLQYLHRGGRIGRAQAYLGSLLRIKPVLAIRQGHILPVRKTRTRSQGFEALRQLTFSEGDPKYLSVMQSSSATDASGLKSMLTEEFPGDEIVSARIGPAIGTHVGPRAVGVSVIYNSK